MANRFYGRMGRGAGKQNRINKRREAELRQAQEQSRKARREREFLDAAQREQNFRDWARLYWNGKPFPPDNVGWHINDEDEGYIR